MEIGLLFTQKVSTKSWIQYLGALPLYNKSISELSQIFIATLIQLLFCVVSYYGKNNT